MPKDVEQDTVDALEQFHEDYPFYCKKKAYIAGPISKYGWSKAMRHWHEASVIHGRLVGQGDWSIDNPAGSVHAKDNFDPQFVDHEDWMGEALSKLVEMVVLRDSGFLEVAIIIMLPGWEESDGACKEFTFAREHGIPAYQFVWINRDQDEWQLKPMEHGEA